MTGDSPADLAIKGRKVTEKHDQEVMKTSLALTGGSVHTYVRDPLSLKSRNKVQFQTENEVSQV